MNLNKRIITKYFILATVTVVAAYVILNAASIWNYARVDETRNTDVAIVLGAGISDDKPSPVFAERVNHAVRLYENGMVNYIIITGGIGEGNLISDSAVAKKYAVSKGVPENVIFTEDSSTITEENLMAAKSIMYDNSWQSALVVSDPLHMKRAMLMSKDYGIEAYSSPTSTSMYKSLKTKLPFLIREEFFYIGYKIVRIFR